MLSVVIPALNAATSLPATLAAVGAAYEVIVADGGSDDGTELIAAAHGARVVEARRGRGSQLAAGVAQASGDWVLLLHADTRLGADWHSAAERFMATSKGQAAYFRFALDSAAPQARRLERMVDWRCRRLGLPYGDQGLLISRRLLDAVGGMRPLPLMEDVDLVRRIGRRRLTALDAPATTSAHRWESEGWTRRSARNLACLSLYLGGVPPAWIARLYG